MKQSSIAGREVIYTVGDHIQAMSEANAEYVWYPTGIWQNALGCDWDAFQAANQKASEAGITTNDIHKAMAPQTLKQRESL